ncbi:MAG: alanyl-tRNA editing protein [Lachnospiraceae bacterium]|nr:alanyl-tRNA editing protein [Lachnospiraceae bacterium]
MVKLYDNDAYLRDFTARVTSVEVRSEDEAWITLDATAFFPEEGGQSPDCGTIAGFVVTDVQIAGGVIRHRVDVAQVLAAAGVDVVQVLAAAGVSEGVSVACSIDWEHRYRNMQMHTGEHIFSGLVHGKYGYDNVGFHLSDRTATMDYNGKLTEEQLRELETEANRVIVENRAVRAWYPAREELAGLSYRSKKEIDGDVRLVEIDGVDLCACCAPHVRTCGEVGCFKLIGYENYKGGVRVSYRCGFRAIEDYEERLRLQSSLSRLLSVKQEDLADAVAKLQAERKELAYALVAKDRAIALAKLSAQAERDGRARLSDGRIDGAGVLLLEQADATLLRYCVDEMKKRYAGVVCVLLSTGDASWRYAAEQDGGDVSAWQAKLRETYGARGGGPANSVQGSVTAPREQLEATLAELAAL